MRDVVLVEIDAGETAGVDGEIAPPASGPHRGGSPGDRLGRARRWWPVAAGLALAVATGTVAAGRRETARLAALAEVPGILAPLDGPVTELWRRADTSLWVGPTKVTGRLIGVEHGPDGGVDVVALEPATGEAVWRTAARPPGATDGWASCAVPGVPSPPTGAGAVPVVACVVADDVVITAESTAGYVYYPTRARLLVLDATTGAVVSDAPTEPSTSVAALGADLVISRVDADGRAHVTRTDAHGTADRWTFISPDPVPVDDSRQRVASVDVVGGLVVVEAGSSWVLSADGDVLDVWAPGPTTEPGGRVEVLRGGRLLAEPVAIDDVGTSGSKVMDLTTGRPFEAAGSPVHPVFDDGSLGDLLLMESSEEGDLVAYDIASGRPRWTIADTAGGGIMVVDGRVIRAEGDELQSIDGRTGKPVWANPVGEPAPSPQVTDGRLVLLTQQDPDRGTVLAAYGLDDGRLRWSAEVTDGVNLFYLFAIDGGLYGWSDLGLVALGQDAA